jgi:hypothetical protein
MHSFQLAWLLMKQLNCRGQGNLAGRLERIAVGTGAESWQSNGATLVLDGKFQRSPIGRLQQFCFAALAASPAGTNGVDHITGAQITRCRNDGVSRSASVRMETLGIGHDFRTATAMDGSINPTTARQMLIGGVDDGIDLLERNIADLQFQSAIGDVGMHVQR